MQHAKKQETHPVESLESVTAVIAGFDYRVEPDDFVLYELARMIEEDRASLDDEEFRRLIDEGIREHVEENMQVRAELAGILRTAMREIAPSARPVAIRVIHVLEDADSDLRNVGVVVRTYTAYLFDRLQNPGVASPEQDQAGRAADRLFDAPEDRATARTAIAVLASLRSSVSARILAHVVSEPMLEEDLEGEAFAALHGLWPLARHYMLYRLRNHTHEDLPYRWFRLFMDVGEPAAVDLVLEELRAHGENPAYREDLSALVGLLLNSRDPETQDKVMALLNSPQTPRAIAAMLEDFLKEYRPPAPSLVYSPWARQTQLAELNRKYKAAAKLFDMGRVEEALRALDEILAVDPEYAFALMLKSLVENARQ